MQAKDIKDDEMLTALAAVRGKNGAPNWSSLYDVYVHFAGTIPQKVVLAKLRSMVKRHVIRGCACGCRGDFELPGAS